MIFCRKHPVADKASYPNQEVAALNFWEQVVYAFRVGKKQREVFCRCGIRKDYLRQQRHIIMIALPTSSSSMTCDGMAKATQEDLVT